MWRTALKEAKVPFEVVLKETTRRSRFVEGAKADNADPVVTGRRAAAVSPSPCSGAGPMRSPTISTGLWSSLTRRCHRLAHRPSRCGMPRPDHT